MRRICVTLGLIGVLLAALAVPGGASASHLSRADFKSASKYCKALRAETGAKAFKRTFSAKRVRGAHRRCVRKNRTVRENGVRALAPVAIFPVPAETCPPGTVPEPPMPVRAFADVCVEPAPVVTSPGDDGDEDAEEAEDQDSDDDESDDDDDDDDDDDSDDD